MGVSDGGKTHAPIGLAVVFYLRRYGYTHTAPSLYFYEHGRMSSEAVLMWMHADDVALDLARFLDVLWPEINAAVVGGSRQNPVDRPVAPQAHENAPIARA